MNIFRELVKAWQELRDSTLISANATQRLISYWTKEERISYLQWKTKELAGEISRIHQGYINLTEKDVDILTKKVFLFMSGLKKREKLLKGLTFSLRLMEHPEFVKGNGISPEMIAEARNFPLEELVEVNNRGFAHCVNHKPDKNPSMYCKKNWAFCFSCGFSGDSISVFQKISNVNFIEAVHRLSRVETNDTKTIAGCKKSSQKIETTHSQKQTRQNSNTVAKKEMVLWQLIEGEK